LKVLVFGNGWLGNKIANYFSGGVSLANIFDINAVDDAIVEFKPDVVVNAAAKCGRPNIDWCNKPENRAITEAVNAYAPRILQSVCAKEAVKFVHISSGCIWENGVDIKETRLADPPSFYAVTKVMAETMLRDDIGTLVIRPRMPIDDEPGPRNLINKLAGYTMVLREQNSVTVIKDLLTALEVLLKKDCSGIYHVANPGSISGTEIMEMYCEYVDQEHAFQIVDMHYLWEHKLISDGRSNVVLNTDKLKSEGVELMEATERVRGCIKEYAECKSNISQPVE